MKIVVEIGAHNGVDSTRLVHESDKAYLCEPDPEQFINLVRQFADVPHVTLWPFAIAAEHGVANFNISLGERGICSLHELHPNLANTALVKYPCFTQGFQKKVPVWTTRLDYLMELYDIPHIDMLWVDAQGNDLIALQSLGKRIYDVKEGRCETTYKVPIYQGVDNSYHTVVSFLESVGFKHRVDYVHENDSEIDVKFWRV